MLLRARYIEDKAEATTREAILIYLIGGVNAGQQGCSF